MSKTNFLAEMKKRYPDCNLLLPQETDAKPSPFLSYHVTQVQADTSADSGDVFKVGSVNRNGQFIEQFSLSKPLLNKMANAAGIAFDYNSMRTTFSADNTVVTCSIAGFMKRPDGTPRVEADSKTISVKDEELRYREEAEDKARNGIVDARQAEAASKLFDGRWFDTKNRYNKTVKGFLIDEKDREKYIDRYVKTNLAQLRKTWVEKAMTGAKLRVIRSLLGVKGTYTMAELQKPFVIPMVIFTPDYSNPMVQQFMLAQSMNGVAGMFGVPNIPVTQLGNAEQADAADVVDEGFVSEHADEDYEGFGQMRDIDLNPMEEPPVQEPGPQIEQPAETIEGCVCSVCGKQIRENVYDYSLKRFGAPLCYDCQKTRRAQR